MCEPAIRKAELGCRRGSLVGTGSTGHTGEGKGARASGVARTCRLSRRSVSSSGAGSGTTGMLTGVTAVGCLNELASIFMLSAPRRMVPDLALGLTIAAVTLQAQGAQQVGQPTRLSSGSARRAAGGQPCR